MKTQYFLVAAAALILAACTKDPIKPDESDVFDFGFNVQNNEYVAEVVLKGVGEAGITSADNLPPWIPEITLKEEKQNGEPVALVSVKGDPNLTEKRTAQVVLHMTDGKTVNLDVSQWPLLLDNLNASYQSFNTALEKDWASAQTVRLVVSNETINGLPEIHEQEIALPWAFDRVPTCYLPRGNGSDESMEVWKMVNNKNDWSLVFNLTGINALPNYNYFGLYNKYMGILRVFYYFTQDMVPGNNTSDHLWSFAVNANLAEHIASEFALPAKEPVTPSFRSYAARPVLTTPTTDNYNPLAANGESTPAVGWWAFDVNMAPYRKHNFFEQDLRNAFNINLCTYNEQRVILNSVLQGNLNGVWDGKMNLDVLAPTAMNGFCKAVLPILTTGQEILSNTWFLDQLGKIDIRKGGAGDVVKNDDLLVEVEVGGGNDKGSDNGSLLSGLKGRQKPPTKALLSVGSVVMIVGGVVSLITKYMSEYGSSQIHDNDLGKINGSMSLDLNAVMRSEGTIGSSTTNKVPPASMSMEYIKKTNPDGTPTSIGKGVWNLDNHPVVYIVKDAYWSERQFNVFSSQPEYQLEGKDVYSYDLGPTKGSRPGLRLISFLDPTSVGGLSFNEDLFDKEMEGVKIYVSYGVYPGSKPGYTDAFRKAEGLDYDHTWRLCEKNEFDSSDELRLIKKLHTDDLFNWTSAPEELSPIAGMRLSSQKLRTDHVGLERRYYGQSLYYSNPYATAYDVDQVQFVYDPQVFVPFDENGRKLYDPQVPDFVVTATIVAKGQDSKDSEESTLTSTLRFLPRIQLVSIHELNSIYDGILARKEEMGHSERGVNIWAEMESQIQHIKDIVDAAH